MVDAIFFISLRLDFQSMGIGMVIRYMSVETFAAKETQTIGLDTAAWHISEGRKIVGR
jgi:hypothetical protein